jgi:hypothetical protein
MTPGCFLYTPPREWFGGASILVTNWSTFSDLSFYDYTKNFAHIVAQNQDFLIEWARIKVLNGVDKVYAQSQKKSADGHAWQIATKLKKYGFTIVGAESAEIPSELTTVTIYGDQEYQSTIQLLQKFFSIGEILRSEIPTKIIENELWEQQELIEDMWFDIVITLWNQYLDERPGQFNFNM